MIGAGHAPTSHRKGHFARETVSVPVEAYVAPHEWGKPVAVRMVHSRQGTVGAAGGLGTGLGAKAEVEAGRVTGLGAEAEAERGVGGNGSEFLSRMDCSISSSFVTSRVNHSWLTASWSMLRVNCS